jgi:hypothetical protein
MSPCFLNVACFCNFINLLRSPQGSEATNKTLNYLLVILQWGAELFFVWSSFGFVWPKLFITFLAFFWPACVVQVIVLPLPGIDVFGSRSR